MKNPQTQALLAELKRTAIESESPLYKRLASDLEKPTRQMRVVNIFKIERYANDGEIIVVPGKVLAEGELTKKITVAALSFSDEARRKIEAKGTALSMQELLAQKPKKVRILG